MPFGSTILAASLSSIFGTLALFLAVAFARYKFRQRKSRRAQPVDPKYEATVSADGDSQASGKEAKRWFGGAWGVTPVAEAGPGGTKQYLSGWFGLDAPSTAGWSVAGANDDFASTYGSNASTYTSTTGSASSSWRESHFSRASRASRRAAIAASRSKKSGDPAGKEMEQDKGSKGGRKLKKKPRVSRTTELGMLERDDDDNAKLDKNEDKKREERVKLKVEEMEEVDLDDEREGDEGEKTRLTATAAGTGRD